MKLFISALIFIFLCTTGVFCQDNDSGDQQTTALTASGNESTTDSFALLIISLVALLLALASIAFMVLIYFFLKKIISMENQRLENQRLENQREDQWREAQRLENQRREARRFENQRLENQLFDEYKRHLLKIETELSSIAKNPGFSLISKNSWRIDKLETRFNKLEGDKEPQRSKPRRIKHKGLRHYKPQSGRTAFKEPIPVITEEPEEPEPINIISPEEVLSSFNEWAADPSSPLPELFYYLKGSFYTRKTQPLEESSSPTKWITNCEGTGKYLFPNPNFFDDRTEIHGLYKHSQSFRPKGQNRIKVIKPCEMEASGYIEFVGELELI